MSQGWTFKTDNKLRGAYGETDYGKKLVRINKKAHKTKGRRITPNKDGSENLLTTIVHEHVHTKYPQKKERATEKLARAMVKRMPPKHKARMYAKVK